MVVVPSVVEVGQVATALTERFGDRVVTGTGGYSEQPLAWSEAIEWPRKVYPGVCRGGSRQTA